MFLDTYQKARCSYANGVIFNKSTAAEVEWKEKHPGICSGRGIHGFDVGPDILVDKHLFIYSRI